MRRYVSAIAMLGLVLALGVPAMASTVDADHGTWTAYPGQSTSYAAAVQQPINADGTSNFKANGKGVIPVKFALAQGTGPFVFQSIFSDSDPGNDYSFLNFDPDAPLTLADITELSAQYAFSSAATCQGGSLRWTVRLDDGGTLRNLDIHYQPGADSLSQQVCTPGTSGENRVDLASSDAYVVINQFTYGPYTFSDGYNVTYAEAVSQLGALPVLGMTLILDSGWGEFGDQVMTLTSATVGVGGGDPYSETFTPDPSSATATVCPTDQATISIDKVSGAASGTVNEPVSIQPQDNDGQFRIVDCKYMYNLATSSLSGAGRYVVSATIGGSTFEVAAFDLK